MWFLPSVRPLAVFVFSLISANQVYATTISNGDFSNGLNGYSERYCTFFCGPDTNNAGSVVNLGTDPYLQLQSPGFVFGSGQIEVSQSVSLGDTDTLLSFDAGLISSQDDLSTQSPDGSRDFFTLLLQTTTTLDGLFTLDSTGAAVSSVYTGAAVPSVSANPVGSFFDYAFSVDLSAFANQTVDLIFVGVSRPDLRITNFGVDNIALSAQPTVPPVATVPLPAGFILLLSGIVFLRPLRQH